MVATPPFAYLFELGGNTICAPAILHFVMQGAVKVIQPPDQESPLFPIVWMAACAALPYLVFLPGDGLLRRAQDDTFRSR